jgi:hypothetical protein
VILKATSPLGDIKGTCSIIRLGMCKGVSSINPVDAQVMLYQAMIQPGLNPIIGILTLVD